MVHRSAEPLVLTLALGVMAAAVGSVLADRSRMGVIDLLLLFGPLVVVPLALPLVAGRTSTTSAWAVLGSSTLLVLAFGAAPSSAPAVVSTLPWLAVTVALAAQAVARWHRSARRDPVVHLRTLAVVWLPLAAAHITLSRAGTTYGGIPPQLIELAGVHFTFAGFGATTLAVCMVAASEGRRRSVAIAAGALLTLGSATVGVGHLTARAVEVAGTSLVTVAVFTLAALGWTAFPKDTAERILLRLSGLAVVAPMGFALAYSRALATGSDHLPYETIAAIHGSLNALGFVTCGLLAWRSATRTPRQRRAARLGLGVWGHTILGGGLCGTVCLGLISVLLTPLTFPIGAALGVLLGAPVGLVVAIVVGRSSAIDEDPTRLVGSLSSAGVAIALGACTPAFLFAAMTVRNSFDVVLLTRLDQSLVRAVAMAVNAVVGVGAVVYVGLLSGRGAAEAHVARAGDQASIACRDSMVSAADASLSSR